MKFFKLKLFYLLLAGMALLSCEKEEDRVTFRGGTAPVLVASSTEDLTLTKATENYSSLQFQWTNPEYEFSNGVNTQDVTYTLEIDTTGSNFTNDKAVALTFTRDLYTGFLVKELNNTLSVIELKDFEPHNFEFRVKATLPGGTVPVYSNVVQIQITTYLDVVYPVPSKLFITGAATPNGWMADGDPEDSAQEFTMINSYTFEITSLQINGSSPFLFVPVYGNWSNKYGFTGDGLTNNPNGDSFRPEGNDMVSPSVTKAYKITVNFKTGRYSFE
jgi:hypothetical protein